MSLADFTALNERRAEAGQSTFMNPRNSAAGTIRQLDPADAAGRPLSIWCYQVGVTEGGPAFKTHWEALQWLTERRFRVNPDIQLLDSEDEVIAQCLEWQTRRGELDFEIDGVVVKVSDLELQRRLGSVGRDPRWAVAWKFPPTIAVTRLNKVMWNVGQVRRHAPLRRARARRGRRRDDQNGDTPQRGGSEAQGHSRRRGRARGARRRRDPAGHLPGSPRGRAGPAPAASAPAAALPVLRHARRSSRPIACSRSAPTATAPPARGSCSSTSSRAGRWTSRASVRSRLRCFRSASSSARPPTSTG